MERWAATASGVLLRSERWNVRGESEASVCAACQRRRDPPTLDGVDGTGGTGVANSGSGGGIDEEDDDDDDDDEDDGVARRFESA